MLRRTGKALRRDIEALAQPPAGGGLADGANGNGSSGDAGRIARVAAACRSGDEVAWESVGKIASGLGRGKRAAELLDLHAGLDVPLSSLTFRQAVILAGVEWEVAFMQGPVPDDVCGVAGKRVAQLLDLGILGRAEAMG